MSKKLERSRDKELEDEKEREKNRKSSIEISLHSQIDSISSNNSNNKIKISNTQEIPKKNNTTIININDDSNSSDIEEEEEEDEEFSHAEMKREAKNLNEKNKDKLKFHLSYDEEEGNKSIYEELDDDGRISIKNNSRVDNSINKSSQQPKKTNFYITSHAHNKGNNIISIYNSASKEKNDENDKLKKIKMEFNNYKSDSNNNNNYNNINVDNYELNKQCILEFNKTKTFYPGMYKNLNFTLGGDSILSAYLLNKSRIKDGKNIFNLKQLERVLLEKCEKNKIKILANDEVITLLNDKLNLYIRKYLTKLIAISRIRNVNFNLFSNNPNGQTHYKFKTFNWVTSNNEKEATFSIGKSFDILFTTNYKKKFDLIEEYVELSNKKLRFEKLSSCKEKYEENNKKQGIENSIKITDGPNPTIKLLPGRRTKKKNSLIIKDMKNHIIKSKKKEEYNKQKSFTANTLNTFLDDNIVGHSQTNLPEVNSTLGKNDLLSSKMSDTLSVSEGKNVRGVGSINNNNLVQNEINMNVFTYSDVTRDGKIFGQTRRRINVKDFIFLLEESDEYIPNKLWMLNKAATCYNK